jgi:hypothetical protein
MTAIKADITAANRVLNAAVRKARAEIAEGEERVTAKHGEVVWAWRDYDREAIVEMFNAAQVAANLLLEAS